MDTMEMRKRRIVGPVNDSLEKDYPFLRPDYLKDVVQPVDPRQGEPDAPVYQDMPKDPREDGRQLVADAGPTFPASAVQKLPDVKPDQLDAVKPATVVKAQAAATALGGMTDKDQKQKAARTLIETDPEMATAIKQARENKFGSELGYLFEQLSAAIDKRAPDKEFWNKKMADADAPVKQAQQIAETIEKRQSQSLRARESDLREAEFGLREKELNGRLTDAEVQRERLKLENKMNEQKLREGQELKDPESAQSKRVQQYVGLTQIGKDLSPDQVKLLSASDWPMIKDLEEGRIKIENVRAALEEKRLEAGERSKDRALQREIVASNKDQARQDRVDRDADKKAEGLAKVQVGGFVLAPGARPSDDDAKKMKTSAENYLNINSGLQRWKSLYENNGTEQGWGTVKDTMEKEKQSIVMQLKDMENLGVLSGDDAVRLEAQLPDTTSWKPMTDKTIRSAFKTFETQLRDRLRNGAKTRGYVWSEDPDHPAQEQAPTTNKSGPAVKTVDHYLQSPDGKRRVPVYSDGTYGKEERM